MREANSLCQFNLAPTGHPQNVADHDCICFLILLDPYWTQIYLARKGHTWATRGTPYMCIQSPERFVIFGVNHSA